MLIHAVQVISNIYNVYHTPDRPIQLSGTHRSGGKRAFSLAAMRSFEACMEKIDMCMVVPYVCNSS